MRKAGLFLVLALSFTASTALAQVNSIVLDGYTYCTRADNGRPVCRNVSTGRFSFVSEEFFLRYAQALLEANRQHNEALRQQEIRRISPAQPSSERVSNPVQERPKREPPVQPQRNERLDRKKAQEERQAAVDFLQDVDAYAKRPKSQVDVVKLAPLMSSAQPVLSGRWDERLTISQSICWSR